MIREHQLKCHPAQFSAIRSGEKNFEVRRDDRGFQRGDFVVDVEQGKYRRKGSYGTLFEAAMKLTQDKQLKELARVVGTLVTLNVSYSPKPPLSDPAKKAFCEALGAPLYDALKKHFDPKEYFGSVNAHIARKQLKEMFGKGYQAKWDNEKKTPLEKIAIAKAKETGWLPPELRTSFYTGPGAEKKRKEA